MSAAPYYSLETDSLGTLRLRGAISFANAGQAYASPPQAPQRSGSALDIDLTGLENADSATLAVLIAWSAEAGRRGAKLRYLRAPEGLRNLAKLAEVESLLNLV